MLSRFYIALVDIVDCREDDIQFGGFVEVNLGEAGLAFEDKIWFIAAVVGEYGLEHVVEIGGFVGVGIGGKRFS